MCIAEASARPSWIWALASAFSSSWVILINCRFFSVLNQRYSVWDFICNAFHFGFEILDFGLSIPEASSLTDVGSKRGFESKIATEVPVESLKNVTLGVPVAPSKM